MDDMGRLSECDSVKFLEPDEVEFVIDKI